MTRALVAAGLGALFGLGLLISGMTRPEKVVGFLDMGGAWDPALLLVMVGAIGVYLPTWAMVRRRRAPLLDARFHWPEPARVDARLLLGAALFGVGWGLSGYCPGPAVVALPAGGASAAWFAVGLAGGFVLFRGLDSLGQERRAAPTPPAAVAPPRPAPVWVTDG